MGLVFHLGCIAPRFAFSPMPPCHPFQVTSGSRRVTFCLRLFPVCVLRGAIAGWGGIACMFPKAGISFIPVRAWPWALFLQCCLSSLTMFFAKLFFFDFQVSFFAYQGTIPFLFHTCLCFHSLLPTRRISEGSPPSRPTRTTWCLFFADLRSICWRWRLCIFLTFPHNINSLYPLWIIGRLTAIWKSRWCFPDLPPPSLSWLKGN